MPRTAARRAARTETPDPGTPGSRRTALYQTAAGLGLAILALPLVRAVPLPDLHTGFFISGYGVTDNRRLLLGFLWAVFAILMGPWLVALVRNRGHRESDQGGMPSPGRSDRPAVAAAAVLAAVLLVGPGVAFGPLDGHEMVHLGYLNELDHGRLLNIDTRMVYGPLSGYLLYGFMKLTWFSLFGFRLYWNVLAAATLALLGALSRPYFRSRWLWAAMLLWVLLGTDARYFLPDVHGINHGFWGWGNTLRHAWVPLCALGLAGRLMRTRRAWPRVLAGFLAVLGGAFAQEAGPSGLAVLGLLVVLAAGPGRRGVWRDGAFFLAGAGAAAAVILAPAAARGALPGFAEATWRSPGLFIRGAGDSPFPVFSLSNPSVLAFYAVPALDLGLLLASWILVLRGRGRSMIVLAVSLYASLSFLTVLVRADAPHLHNVALAPILAGGLALDDWAGTPARWTGRFAGRFRPAPAVGGVLLVLTVAFHPGLLDVLAGLWGRARHPDPAPPAGLVPLWLSRGHIWVPRNTWFDNAAWAGGDDPRGPLMMRRLSGGTPTTVLGAKAGLYYFLAGSPCATSYTDPPSQRLTPADFARERLEFHRAAVRFFYVPEAEDKGPDFRVPGYRRLGARYGLVVYQREDEPPAALPDISPPPGRGP